MNISFLILSSDTVLIIKNKNYQRSKAFVRL